MRNKFLSILVSVVAVLLIVSGCSKKNTGENNSNTGNKKIHIVTTTTMLKDLIENIGGDKIEVEGLMGEGVDPHLYKPTASDVEKLKKADVIIYQGLHLEGKMESIFSELKDKKIINASDGISKDKIKLEENGTPDPHIWFDIDIWKEVGDNIQNKLSEFYTDNKDAFKSNYDSYKKELDNLDKYVKMRAEELSKEQRALVTAHDAFSYFANRYGFDVLAIQGVSTEAEATTSDIENLAKEITDRKIKAIFVESSVPEKTIKSLQEAVKSKGHEITIGGELYSDSLGDKANNSETYIKTVKANIDTIVNALK
ncbi:zinc ABC transporter substrate-binding protein [Gemella sp. GH3]|uniref:metal ABC transporter solute-binding protein, Zn/Mn family n=1 Tax=unclassified Gemella TaxID=2624949 RepID=UPI0015D036EA|nr:MULTISPECIES: zinc ABC transporter substrate-binding protein [unclassified Gemella]MBF0713576.1 zinc ABC transporter substrate-binding protein [Gemella sp. GH3.1]NYS50528.1 zinc ABC transporter substrate-binding protein [Gemella sp. GH3]